MIHKQKTWEAVAEERRRAGKNPPKRCPKCKKGALLLISNIESGMDGEIYERSFVCSWCGEGHYESDNPYPEA